MRIAHPIRPPLNRKSSAFTIVEIMIVVIILSVCSLIAMDGLSSLEANQRADRAARESLVWFRFARNLAITTGKNAKVAVDISAGSLSVYWQSNGSTYDSTPYATSMTATGAAVLTLNNNRQLSGTAVSLNPAGITYFEFTPSGSCNQTGAITFSYAGRTKSLVISSAGDPQIQ